MISQLCKVLCTVGYLKALHTLGSHHVTPDLPQTSTDPLEDAELRYAITLSKEIQQKVRGRGCAQLTGQPVISYLSFYQLEFLTHIKY